MKLELFWQIFEKFWNIKFNENPLSGSQIVPHGRSDGRRTGGRIDLTMLIVAFRSFANAPKTNRLIKVLFVPTYALVFKYIKIT